MININKYCVMRYLLAIGLSLFFVNANAQLLDAIKDRFNTYQQNTLTEKVFIHTNKNFYLSGEILWFKVYNVDAGTNKPLTLSKVAYVELLDANDAPVMQVKTGLKQGSGNGSFYIPPFVTNGNYKLRAYTSWMKNFAPESFFERTISIVNAQRSPTVAAAAAKPAYDVQFFPEGGHWVEGLPAKLAFKITGTDGLGVNNATGAIVDQRNDTVARFVPLKYGLGSFNFTPLANNTYRAVVKVNKVKVDGALPAVDKSGYTLQTIDKGEYWEVAIRAKGVGDNNAFLFAYTRNTLKLAQNISLLNDTASFKLDKAALGEGLSHITLFNAGGTPVCERLVFKRPTTKLNVTARTDAERYGTRQKVSLAVAAADQSQQALPADLSVSVFKVDALTGIDGLDIAGYLWLSSELKGYIENVSYYFSDDNKAAEATENLVLAQGWRRFEWKDIMAGKPAFKYLPELNGHIVTGRLLDAQGYPAKNITTYLAVPGKRVQLFVARSDTSGRIRFNTKDFYGANEVVLQTNFNYDSTYKAKLTDPFAETFTAQRVPKLQLSDVAQQDLESNNLSMQVQNVYNAANLRKFYDPQVDSSAFFGKPVNTYFLDGYVRFPTLEEVFREYTSWLFVSKVKGKFKINMINRDLYYNENPLMLYNGIPVFDMNSAFAIDALKVKRLDVVNTGYFYGPARFEGILSLTGYKDDLAGYKIDPRAVVLDYEGLQLERKFYSPVYDTEQLQQSRKPDMRNALYWQPDAFTNAQGKYSSTFYTSDQAGKYIGVVQGISSTGHSGSGTFSFEVKK